MCFEYIIRNKSDVIRITQNHADNKYVKECVSFEADSNLKYFPRGGLVRRIWSRDG